MPVFRDAFHERHLARVNAHLHVRTKRKYDHHDPLRDIPIIVGFARQSGLMVNHRYWKWRPNRLIGPLFVLNLNQRDLVQDIRLKKFLRKLGDQVVAQERSPSFTKNSAYVYFHIRCGTKKEVGCNVSSYNARLTWGLNPEPECLDQFGDIDAFVESIKDCFDNVKMTADPEPSLF